MAIHVIKKKSASDPSAKIKLAPTAPRPAVMPQFLLVDEVAEMLRVHPREIYKMVSRRRIPFLKIGRRLRFDAAEITAWTKAGADNQ